MPDLITSPIKTLLLWLPPLVVLVISAIILLVARHYLIKKQGPEAGETQWIRQLLMLLLTFSAIIVFVLFLPLGDSTRGQLLSFLGILATGVIALSSTTFVGNAMAGLMLRAVQNFKPGDFLHVADHYGRVSEQGLLHTEIQTEGRDLTTLPNLYLVTNPVTVVRSSGTIISSTVSLGYDIPFDRIEKALKEAATNAGLKEPFVHVLDLGDFSVTYRASGFLTDVKFLLSTRSKLKIQMLESLHKSGIEIVSPTFMNQRQISPSKTFIPTKKSISAKMKSSFEKNPEEIMFDKAEKAESQDKLRERLKEIKETIEEVKDQQEKEKEEHAKDRIAFHLSVLEREQERILSLLEKPKKEEK